ncbi:M16 family metallopeptidase [Paludifilum halophilum]|uniref:Peptidase M16 n=1 Tax=Paludifilum halophilum TaxID=1642702 RepID=A0A235BBU4_9BACL|nr:pitrilysin family protein [Paludifilum halophilum]OYD09489.1 peptidase M16 [Paludifilum halophilum]
MIAKHTLSNGVRVVAEKMPHVRSVAFGLWIGTGSRNETPENNGISHFLEHMMFKGTDRRTTKELAETFDEIGGQVNAFTSKEMTCYYAKVLDQHLHVAMDVLSDMFFYSTLAEEEIAKERKVIVEEIRMVEDTPDDIVHDWLSLAAMQEHSLGLPVLGGVETVNGFNRTRLIEYRRKQYQPQQLVIALAGNLPDDYLEQLEQRFNGFEGEGFSAKKEPPPYTGDWIAKKKPIEQTHLCLGLPGLSIGDSGIYALILLNNLLGGNMSSRLFQEVREERGLAYSVFSYHSAYSDSGLFTIYAGTAPGQENEVIEVMIRELDELRQHGVTDAELQKGKEQLKGSLMMSLESTENRMGRLGKNELLLREHPSLDEVVRKIEGLSREDILNTARRVFSNPLALSVISPDGGVPSAYRRDALVL